MSTRYPLVLVPGMLGFIRLVLYPYWFGIIKALRRGGATVVAVQVSPLNSTEVRGEQLLARIEEILRESGAQKVNLFGHSQGALTARYAAAKRPDLVASVTSVAGPNHGSELADYLEKHYPGSSAKGRLLEALLRLIGWVMALLDTGYHGPKLPVDIHASHQSLTTAGVALFNQRYPQGLPEVWGGQGRKRSTVFVITPGQGRCNRARPIVAAIFLTAPTAVVACLPRPSSASRGSAMAWSAVTARIWAR